MYSSHYITFKENKTKKKKKKPKVQTAHFAGCFIRFANKGALITRYCSAGNQTRSQSPVQTCKSQNSYNVQNKTKRHFA